MTLLRGHFAMTLICAGTAGDAEIQDALVPLTADGTLTVTVREVPEEHVDATDATPWVLTVHGGDRPGIVSSVVNEVAAVGGNITDLTIERVKVRAPWDGSAPNTDAIDPGPVTRAWIHHCDIDTGDDNIVIKSGGTDILIEDNVIKHGHGISIGSETTAGVNRMLVRRCSFEDTDNGIRIKSMRGAGGLVQNIRYTDITMKNVPNPIVLQLDYTDNNRPDFKGDPEKVPAIRHILIDHVIIKGARNAGIIHGLPDSPITNITLQDITVVAENDFDIKDAEDPVFERVSRIIKTGVAPPKPDRER